VDGVQNGDRMEAKWTTFRATQTALESVRTRTLKETGGRSQALDAVLCERWRSHVLAWWPSAVAVQAEAANHHELLRSRAVVVSVVGKGAPVSASGVDHEGERKRTTEEVSKEPIDGVKTGACSLSREEPGGCLLIARAASGMEVARAWSGLSCGTCEPASRWGGWPVARYGLRSVVWSEKSKRQPPRGRA